ncbi:PREDICTED: homeodomain-interacting protein kinase 4 isoform X1 [Ficedula albicollis]|uniref:homeodomain-interacting protein kinase 4 isoform X1 n=1 Tax=Ficedula albicollis TaxID=59894 RepID=UPI000359C5FE|nr:PREDICTED: homeodomain-interacting protein kinase 4 isoform X1 [Ficedula albicollis]
MVTLVVGAECYDIMAMVGKGTFGQVMQGQCRSTGEMVAIKILKNCDHDGQIVKNELRLLQALREGDTKDSHIIHFLESFSDTVWTYLVFELLQQNLFDFQKQSNFSPLPVRHIRTIAAQVLLALLKLKELSIIHADLKPENIMLVDHARYPFRIKLVDFGSAILLPEVCHVQEPYIQTRFYRAPEILLGLPFCEKVDIWSLGCVMAELHLGWPLYPGNDEYDQICYICSTLGLPRAELLYAAQKTRSFFQRVPCSSGTWQLKPPRKVMAKPMERREHIFSSLDQLAVVNVCPTADPDQEELAKRCDLYRMVELLKRMLTWDSHERITPSAALHHPFISMQEVKTRFEATRYYQLSQEDLRVSCKDSSIAKIFPSTEKGAFIPASQGGIQKATAQMDGLSLAEPAGDTSDKCQQDLCQASSPTHCGSQYCQHHWCPQMEPTKGHLTVLGSPSRMKRYSHWYGSPVLGGIMKQNLPGRCYSSSCAKTALVMWRNPKPPGIWRMGFRGWAGTPLQCSERFYHRASGTPSTTETPQQPLHSLQQPRACKRPSSSSPSSTPTAKTQRLAGGDNSQGCNRTYCARCYRLCFSH